MVLIPVGRVRPTAVSVDLDLGDGKRAQRGLAALEKVTFVAAQN